RRRAVRPVDRCPVCDRRDLAPFAMNPWAPGTLHFAQASCRGCGLLIAQPQADDAEIDAYYQSAYYQTKWPDSDVVWAENAELCRDEELPRLRRMWADWPPPPGGLVAEIGCGYGVMMGILGEEGFRARGCEPSERAVVACRARGLDVVIGQTPGLPLPR